MKRTGLLASMVLLGLLLGAVWRSGRADESATSKPGEPDLSSLMQKKQEFASRVLVGLVNEDYEEILTAADSLLNKGVQDAIKDFEDAVDDETYEHFRLEFMLQSSQLMSTARKKNLPGATLYFQNLVQTCIDCHQHLRLDAPEMALR